MTDPDYFKDLCQPSWQCVQLILEKRSTWRLSKSFPDLGYHLRVLALLFGLMHCLQCVCTDLQWKKLSGLHRSLT